MITKPFRLNMKDFSRYVHRYGITAQYTPIQVLADKYTLDGTLHSDVLTNKATYTVKLNPMPPDVAKAILAEIRSDEVLLSIYDIATDEERTVYSKPTPANVTIALVKKAGITHWKISDLVFHEK